MENRADTINLKRVLKRILERRWLFVKALAIAFVLSCVWILPKPRYYSTTIMLAPETESLSGGSGLSSLASSFGFNLGNVTSSDAIYPMLYPDLMESTTFIVDLFDTQIVNEDGDIKTDYYTYLSKHQKISFWELPLVWVKAMLGKLFSSDDDNNLAAGDKGNSDLLVLSKEQDAIAKVIGQKVSCVVDQKTDVITITVTDQDRLVSATMADSVRVKLQNFITEYRTSKARVDLDYYSKLTREAKSDYEEARRLYASYADSNVELTLESYKAKKDDLENDMQLKYNTYSTLNTQLQMAKAKVQERTPAFTILQGAALPQKPAGPKRVIFVLFMLFLTFTGTLLYAMKDDILRQFRQ